MLKTAHTAAEAQSGQYNNNDPLMRATAAGGM
jgi:hypothetical protein